MLSSECSVGHFPLTDATDHLDKGCESREQVSVREVDENAKLEPVLLKRKKNLFSFFPLPQLYYDGFAEKSIL